MSNIVVSEAVTLPGFYPPSLFLVKEEFFILFCLVFYFVCKHEVQEGTFQAKVSWHLDPQAQDPTVLWPHCVGSRGVPGPRAGHSPCSRWVGLPAARTSAEKTPSEREGAAGCGSVQRPEQTMWPYGYQSKSPLPRVTFDVTPRGSESRMLTRPPGVSAPPHVRVLLPGHVSCASVLGSLLLDAFSWRMTFQLFSWKCPMS